MSVGRDLCAQQTARADVIIIIHDIRREVFRLSLGSAHAAARIGRRSRI